MNSLTPKPSSGGSVGGGSGILKSTRQLTTPSARRKSVMLGSSMGIKGGGSMSAGEAVLETTLDATTKALSVYKDRIRNLIQTNTDLQEQSAQQEKDAIEVMGAMRDDLERRDREIIGLRALNDHHKLAHEKEKKDIHLGYQKKLEDLNAVIIEKEATIKLMEQEVAAVKDFKKKRVEVMKELELQKAQTVDMERRYKETMIRMERKFFEEKVRLQKEANRKVSELAAKAHREAVFTLDETTKEIYKENVRLSEALKNHISAEEEASSMNEKLLKQNSHLLQDKETNDLIVRDKIVQSRNQTQLIQELQAKIATLENTLGHVVREFEFEKELIGRRAQTELITLKRVAAQLKVNLDRKGQEMKYIKRLAHHILRQRTDVEKFFMDALDHVRQELGAQRIQLKKTLIQDFHRSLQSGQATALSRASPDARPAVPDSPTDPSSGGALDIGSLSWEDKEKVLRALFARMNGYIRDDDSSKGGASGRSSTRAHTDRSINKTASFASFVTDSITSLDPSRAPTRAANVVQEPLIEVPDEQAAARDEEGASPQEALVNLH
ncbi:hypothetical protein RI367_001000 [Sorochytrium milnesiophthora]